MKTGGGDGVDGHQGRARGLGTCSRDGGYGDQRGAGDGVGGGEDRRRGRCGRRSRTGSGGWGRVAGTAGTAISGALGTAWEAIKTAFAAVVYGLQQHLGTASVKIPGRWTQIEDGRRLKPRLEGAGTGYCVGRHGNGCRARPTTRPIGQTPGAAKIDMAARLTLATQACRGRWQGNLSGSLAGVDRSGRYGRRRRDDAGECQRVFLDSGCRGGYGRTRIKASQEAIAASTGTMEEDIGGGLERAGDAAIGWAEINEEAADRLATAYEENLGKVSGCHR